MSECLSVMITIRTALFHVHLNEHDSAGRIAVSSERSHCTQVQVTEELSVNVMSWRRVGQTLQPTYRQHDVSTALDAVTSVRLRSRWYEYEYEFRVWVSVYGSYKHVFAFRVTYLFKDNSTRVYRQSLVKSNRENALRKSNNIPLHR